MFYNIKLRPSYETLPSMTKNFNKKFAIFENLPPEMARQRDRLFRTVTSFTSGENFPGKPALLCFGHRGSGKSEIFSSLALKTGLPVISYDSGIVFTIFQFHHNPWMGPTSWSVCQCREFYRGKYHCTVHLMFDWFGITCMTTDNFCFYLQNRLVQTSQTRGQ